MTPLLCSRRCEFLHPNQCPRYETRRAKARELCRYQEGINLAKAALKCEGGWTLDYGASQSRA